MDPLRFCFRDKPVGSRLWPRWNKRLSHGQSTVYTLPPVLFTPRTDLSFLENHHKHVKTAVVVNLFASSFDTAGVL